MEDAVADGGRRESESDDETPLETIAAGAVTLLTLGVAFGLLALGNPFFWVAFPVGFGGGMPLAIGLARWYESKEKATGDGSTESRSDTDAALESLRNRYARGELDDEEFESRVERLLETESVAEASSSVRRRREAAEADEGAPTDDAVERERA